MKVGDMVQDKESNFGPGVIIEYESKDLRATFGRGITKMDIELAKHRHDSNNGLWRVVWSDGTMMSCWGINLEVING
jgi:hypothetical protein